MSTKNIAEMECPACTAAMRFDPESFSMVCDWCGTKVKLEEASKEETVEPVSGEAAPGAAALEAAASGEAVSGEAVSGEAVSGEAGKQKDSIEGFDFASLNDSVCDVNAEDLPIYNCKSCGAELIAPPEQISLTCPYCGNNIVMTDKVSGKLRPNGIIPFKITPKELPAAMKRYYKNKVLLPKDFFSESSMEKVTGVYVPFWLFSGTLDGNMVFSGEKSSDHRQGDYIITETSHYSLNRDISMRFDDVPVDASGKIDDALMDSLEPFDMNDVVDFDMRFLAGFTSERFDEPKDTIADRAKKRMAATAETAISAKAGDGYSNVRKTRGRLKASLTAKYLLLPVYMFNLKYGKKKYEFAVNGQTGKVVGNLPIDKERSRNYFLVRFGAVAAAAIAVFIVRYFIGQ